MKIEETPLAGVLVLTPRRFGDDRGFFAETYNADVMKANGVDVTFVQDNHSLSDAVNTVRGLHWQSPPRAQHKLVRCGRGAFFDVVVDIRVGSPTFGKWFGVELTFENAKMLYVPAGFAHGFATRAEGTEIVYKCSDTYAPETEGALRFDDPQVGIDWGLSGDAILSGKDKVAPMLAEIASPFVYEG